MGTGGPARRSGLWASHPSIAASMAPLRGFARNGLMRRRGTGKTPPRNPIKLGLWVRTSCERAPILAARKTGVAMLDHATGQPGTHTHIDRGYDFYETPNVAVDALLRVEWLPRQPQRIWEPVAGNGAIAKVLRESGYDVVASDVVEREFKRDFVAGFLTT